MRLVLVGSDESRYIVTAPPNRAVIPRVLSYITFIVLTVELVYMAPHSDTSLCAWVRVVDKVVENICVSATRVKEGLHHTPPLQYLSALVHLLCLDIYGFPMRACSCQGVIIIIIYCELSLIT